MSVSFVLEALVVLGAIVMGTRAGGVGVGLWGGLGTFVLVFIFGEAPGEPPAAALAIILAVVTTAALMQAAGGIDWMVAVAAKVIDVGVSDEWVEWFRAAVLPGTATVVLLITDYDADALVREAARFTGSRLVYANVDDALLARLHEALGQEEGSGS